MNETDIKTLNRVFDVFGRQKMQEALAIIQETFRVREDEISDVRIIKKGITNRSFVFSCADRQYIMRISGIGTDEYINREDEQKTYSFLNHRGICDDVIYINPKTGFKISVYWGQAHHCGYYDFDEIRVCMEKLKEFHQMKIHLENFYDFFGYIQYYEDLWKGAPSIFEDYEETKRDIFLLKDFIDTYPIEYSLTHIDPNPDNFLLFTDESGENQVRLIDWEYAAMQDPHFDIAMFCIYTNYTEEQMDQIIDFYFDHQCDEKTRLKIYCYIAVGAMNFSNWCEIKRGNGEDIGELNHRMYTTAKRYFQKVNEKIKLR